jgi:hypothetical protein
MGPVDNQKHANNKKFVQNPIEMLQIHCSNGKKLDDYFNQCHKNH